MTTLKRDDEQLLDQMIRDLEPGIDVADQYTKSLSNGSCRDDLNRIIDRAVERGDLAFEEGYYIQTGMPACKPQKADWNTKSEYYHG